MSVPSTTVPSAVPYITQRYMNQKLEMGVEIIKQKYRRNKKNTPTCKQCGQECKPPTHVQYFMNLLCGAFATILSEDWKEKMTKKVYRRKPKLCVCVCVCHVHIINIFHGCMVWIEKSVMRVTDRHHEACRVMPNSDPERQIFSIHTIHP